MTAIAIIDWLLFVFIAVSVVYVVVFATASLLPARYPAKDETAQPHFLIIIPAYKEDAVILSTVEAALQQDWRHASSNESHASDRRFTVCVVADGMSNDTEERLRSMPAVLLENQTSIHTKAHALQIAMKQSYDPDRHTHVVILDADNIVAPDMLTRLAPYCTVEAVALQAHRCAKNTDTPIAILDAVSEEINNSIFRRGHNRLGLSSALIGSGMCFYAPWFAKAVCLLETAGEDKELERLLLAEGHYIAYLQDIDVLDEKVSNSNNFGQQRRRWLAAQFHTLGEMVHDLPSAIRNSRIDYIDKTLQQALIPRSILIALTTLLTAVSTVMQCTLHDYGGAAKWWILTALLLTALLSAIPRRLCNRRLLQALLALPLLIVRMTGAMLHTRGATYTYIHTQHGETHK